MKKEPRVRIDENLVRQIASLARLELTEAEIELFAGQFQDILDYVGILNEVDTEFVAPAYLSSTSGSINREDQIGESVPTDEFLANAPISKNDYIVIPRVHMEQ